jgi:hexosaminidase
MSFWVQMGRFTAYCGLLIIVALLSAWPSSAETPGRNRHASLSVTWRLIEDFPDNRFAAELTLHNDASEPLAPPWTLYFNSSRSIASESVTPPLVLSHVNGDLYALRPDENCPSIDSGDDCTVPMIGSPWAINVSDAPSGLYLVRMDESGVELRPIEVPLEIEPFPDAAKIRRGAADRVPVVTSASRYAANSALTMLPADALPPVIPTPVAYARLPGTVTIDASTTIVFEPALVNEANSLARNFEQSFDMRLRRQSTPVAVQNSIRLTLGKVVVAGAAKVTGDEAYTLAVKPGAGIEIVGTDPAGVFYGIQSLRGLVPLAGDRGSGEPLTIAATEIADAPRFAYRGLHLDVARNFQRVETVKKLLDLMAFYKLNRFHWHLTDDEGWRIEIKSLPELTGLGSRRGHTRTESESLIPSYGSGPIPDSDHSAGTGYYTQAEFIDVLRYAGMLHIAVIPEIDVPGHSRAAVKAMAARSLAVSDSDHEYQLTDPGDTSKYESVQGWHDNVIDVGRDASYQFLDTVIGELAEMYRHAGVSLEYVHLGGDEVPRGAWEGSPACRAIPTSHPDLSRGQQLEIYFLKRACRLVEQHDATPACWDDCLLFAAADTGWSRRPVAYVWNNVWGWGRESAAYRLANDGFDVVLANATNLYFDLASEKDPLEPGYYWAGFVDVRAPFEFNPFNIYQNARHDSMGQPMSADQFAASDRLTPTGRKHILGIQGQLWSENLRTPAQLDYMAFPRTIALAERAWAKEPRFAGQIDAAARETALAADWNVFANTLGQRELPRLHEIGGNVEYRIPPPGAIIRAGQLFANVAYPGLTIRYTTDGSEPTTDSAAYDNPVASRARFRLRAFDAYGHGGRSIEINALPHQLPQQPIGEPAQRRSE